MPTQLPFPHTVIPQCSADHGVSGTYSLPTLTIARDWRPEDIDRLLGEPDAQTPAPTPFRARFPRAGDRFCSGRVALAEIADPQLNRRLSPALQSARALLQESVGVLLRQGLNRWLTVVRDDEAYEGAQVAVASPGAGVAQERTITSVGAGWKGVRLVSLAPASMGQQAGARVSPMAVARRFSDARCGCSGPVSVA